MWHPVVRHTIPTQITQHRYTEDLGKCDSPETVPCEAGGKQQMYWQQEMACLQKNRVGTCLCAQSTAKHSRDTERGSLGWPCVHGHLKPSKRKGRDDDNA